MNPTEDFAALFAAIYRRRRTVFLVLIAALGSAWYYLQEVPPMFRARAVLLVPGELTKFSLSNEDSNLPTGPVLPDVSEDTRIGLLGLFRSTRVVEAVAAEFDGLNADYLRKHVVADIDATQQLVVVATDTDKTRAVALANQFVATFVAEMQTMAERAPRASLQVLEVEEVVAWEALAVADDQRRQLLEQMGSPDPNLDISLLSRERQRLRIALNDLEVEEARLMAQQPIIEQAIASRPDFALARRTVAENPAYQEALDAAADARTLLAVARVNYQDKHVNVQRAILRLQQAEQRVVDEARQRLVTASEEFQPDSQARQLVFKAVELEAGLAGVAPARARLSEQLQVVDASLAPLPGHRLELSRMDAEITRLREHATRVSERKDELRLALEVGFDFTYMDEKRLAREDMVTELPNSTWAMVFASLAGLVGGVLLALGQEIVAMTRRRLPF